MAAAIFFKASHFVLLSLILHLTLTVEGGSHNYRDALAKSILFFQGQRSGKLHDQDQALGWRGDSALSDGQSDGVDLTGGYYDAGDNVKFNFPMAFTITVLSWGVIENGNKMGQLPEAMAAIRWGTDYLLKSAQRLNTTSKLYAGVGDPNDDHRCWERAEDMDTDRTAYYVTPEKPGSDLAAEMAAAMASASMVFRKTDSKYSRLLLQTAKYVMQFAVAHRGAYSDSLSSYVCPFYCSYSGYNDDLIWGAAWLLRATNDNKYLDLIQSLGDSDPPDLFSWDNKFAGADVLLARRYLVSKDEKFVGYSERAEAYMCKIMPNSPSSTVPYTPGRLMYRLGASNLQYVTSATLLLTTYAKYMAASGHTFECGSFHTVTPAYLRNLAKTQVDYILGDNPMKMSYMVGYGTKFPKMIHHRGSSMPSIRNQSQHIGCDDGMQQYFHSSSANPNILAGAIVGGPDSNDQYKDQREDATQSEPATYINAAIVGPLAYFARTKQY